MSHDDLIWRSAVELTALIRSKEISPVDLVEAVLARIETLNPKLNAFCLVSPDLASADAREVGGHQAECVQLRIERLDPRENGLDEIDGRDLFRANQRRQLDGGPPDQIVVTHEL